MNSLFLSIVLATLPVPQFAPTLPVPQFKTLPPSQLTRLPGPRNHFRCSHCGRSNCLMFLGDHLRRVHGQSMAYLDRVGYRQLTVLHDNIHNAGWKPTKAAPVYRSTCKGGSCGFPILKRLFTGR